MTDHMTESDRPPLTDVELTALSALVNAEACEINAANMGRQSRGEAMAYEGMTLTDAWATIERELKRRRVIS